MVDDTHCVTEYKENKLLNCGVQADNGNFFPTGHCLTSSVCEVSLTLFFRVLSECNKKGETSYDPTYGIVDGALECGQALTNIWPDIVVILCIWHVLRAVHKSLSLKKRWKDYSNLASVERDFKNIMYAMEKVDRDAKLQEFRVKWVEEQQVLSYFETEYFSISRLQMWCLADRA
eukprot:CAMPEP_0184662190 /NCGR_PEP_ID=MMETSP0308-20130426/42036_1 /TAXON_ID=38269 /ORGANISM="Gloeochaete witrockiana, Strain SAG 46.84" /LENGTH=174 /DNA_ID=CAMNT_0027104023 /DNA_START=29 /DNA_END=549 /DNA_ORIENTATION=+